MPFESLSFRHKFIVPDFPERWLPLVHLYDPDLPLFPLYYFHSISDNLQAGQRPGLTDRVYGYIEKINSLDANGAEVVLVLNKDLTLPGHQNYKVIAENEARERLGLNNPVQVADISNAFLAPLDYANPVLQEIWHRVVVDTYGGSLPFGRLWDEVLGLTRFVASWNSDGGRKGEFIQTHYFSSKFGERIQTGGGIGIMDFFLLPTVGELFDSTNPLNSFPNYQKLVEVADLFQANKCTFFTVGTLTLSKFNNPPKTGLFNTAKLQRIISEQFIPPQLKNSLTECFNAFNKGPGRTVIFLMMLSDLRAKRILPRNLSNADLGSIYDGLKKTYQSPKVIHIYAQQAFGNTNALPNDVWIGTFLEYPLNIKKSLPRVRPNHFLLSHSNNIGKVERLIWVAVQARKVHSSACNNALWCIKKAGNKKTRGANPLSCKNCILKATCPAYGDIKAKRITLNNQNFQASFYIETSAGNNTSPGQGFKKCVGESIYGKIEDDFSTSDMPDGFTSFPSQHHDLTRSITVDEFVNLY